MGEVVSGSLPRVDLLQKNSFLPFIEIKPLAISLTGDHVSDASLLKIMLLLMTFPLDTLLRNLLASLIFGDRPAHARWRLLLDFGCVSLLPSLACTVLMQQIERIIIVTVTLIFILLGFLLLKHAMRTGQLVAPVSGGWRVFYELSMAGRRPCVTYCRAFTLISTVICVISVDLGILWGGFVKSWSYGIRLMDIGVGSFVISNAIVSPEARDKYSNVGSLSEKLQRISGSIWSTLPLWILGILRLLSMHILGYHATPTEYGLHWNFFFTLATVRVLSSCIYCVWRPSWSWLLALLIAGSYQWLLTVHHLDLIILKGTNGRGSRSGLFNANREGIASCGGYLAIYLAAVQVGRLVMRPRYVWGEWLHCLLILSMVSLGLWCLLAWSHRRIGEVSRRMANMPFCIWMLALNIQMGGIFLVVDLCSCLLHHLGLIQHETMNEKSPPLPVSRGETEQTASNVCLLEAINRNGLVYFMLGNLLTGLVKFVTERGHVAIDAAIAILVIYMFTISVVTGTLHAKGIILRL